MGNFWSHMTCRPHADWLTVWYNSYWYSWYRLYPCSNNKGIQLLHLTLKTEIFFGNHVCDLSSNLVWKVSNHRQPKFDHKVTHPDESCNGPSKKPFICDAACAGAVPNVKDHPPAAHKAAADEVAIEKQIRAWQYNVRFRRDGFEWAVASTEHPALRPWRRRRWKFCENRLKQTRSLLLIWDSTPAPNTSHRCRC